MSVAFVFALLMGAATTVRGAALTDLVNPFIGTEGVGYGAANIPPGAQVPFGALRLSPDTSLGLEPLRVEFDNLGGYWYGDGYLEAFSHTHCDGAGISDWQNIGVMVTRGLTDWTVVDAGYKSSFSHNTESASPGYYGVNLNSANTFAEVTTCSPMAGKHRYTCRADGRPCHLVFDLCKASASSRKLLDFGADCRSATVVDVEVDEASGFITLQGKMLNNGALTGRNGLGVEVFFYATVASNGTAPIQTSFWENRTLHRATMPPAGTSTTSGSLGVVFGTQSDDDVVVFDVSVALSFVSGPQAAANFNETLMASGTRTTALPFDACHSVAKAEWEEALSALDIDTLPSLLGTDRDAVTTLYTGVYHSMLAPTTYSEANGVYIGRDGHTHTWPNASAGHRYVSDLSLWDTYRTHFPLMTWIRPEMARDTVQSMTTMFQQANGSYPQWPMAYVEGGCMVGHHGMVMVADGIRLGLRGFDVPSAFDATVVGVLAQNAQLNPAGYVPHAATKMLDFAIDAHAVQRTAAYLGNTSLAASLFNATQTYRSMWSDDQQQLCAILVNGSLDCKPLFLPWYLFHGNYREGNAGQYRWYVPHDIPGLLSLFKSIPFAATQLHAFFADSLLWPVNTTLPNPFYWSGNEPTMLTPLLFNYMGNAYAHLSQHWTTVVRDRYYFNGPAGVPGNDDYGAMSSWSVFTTLGLYPVSSTSEYTLCVPRFDNVTLRVTAAGAAASPFRTTAGPVLRAVAYGRPASGEAYLANVSINGIPLYSPILTYDQLLSGQQRRTGATGGGAPVLLEFYLVGEPTVFGAALPSQGGPKPWMPPTRSPAAEAWSRKRMEVEHQRLQEEVDARGGMDALRRQLHERVA